jgi:hypothetical protein
MARSAEPDRVRRPVTLHQQQIRGNLESVQRRDNGGRLSEPQETRVIGEGNRATDRRGIDQIERGEVEHSDCSTKLFPDPVVRRVSAPDPTNASEPIRCDHAGPQPFLDRQRGATPFRPTVVVIFPVGCTVRVL